MKKSFNDRVADAKATVSSVSPAEAAALRHQAGVAFIDPRPASAIHSTTGIIPGALIIPLDTIEAGVLPDELADPTTRVVTTCQAGCMGAVAAHELAKRGFTNVSYLDGGTQGWLDAGLPTVR